MITEILTPSTMGPTCHTASSFFFLRLAFLTSASSLVASSSRQMASAHEYGRPRPRLCFPPLARSSRAAAAAAARAAPRAADATRSVASRVSAGTAAACLGRRTSRLLRRCSASDLTRRRGCCCCSAAAPHALLPHRGERERARRETDKRPETPCERDERVWPFRRNERSPNLRRICLLWDAPILKFLNQTLGAKIGWNGSILPHP